jgi:eukaryotic-like serine/threonine-protein kinase
MATMFHRFEIQSELSKSETAQIYKAMDKETNQVVALKVQDLAPLGDRALAFVDALIAEGEKARNLASQSVVPIFGAGEIDGQFCAAMEYIQGNSVATMLSRNEGFSIWDLLDITRQVCSALDYATSQHVAHFSLEPAKIMVQWDGMVKILGYGISNMGLIAADSGKGLGLLMPYCSPEQIRGEAIDLRSNLFTLGTILYEMVAGQKAFAAADPAALVGQLESEMPPSPSSLNPKIHPAVSAVIMKALAKDPAQRYQHARELLDDLEKCKDNNKKDTATPQKATPSSTIAVDPTVRAAAASKFVSAGASGQNSEPSAPSTSRTQWPGTDAKATAAAAGAGVGTRTYPSALSSDSRAVSNSNSSSSASAKTISDFEVNAHTETEADHLSPRASNDPVMSSPITSNSLSSRPLSSSPVITDPMMSDPVMSAAAPGTGKSFSDLAEMPPLKEVVYTPPIRDTVESLRPTVQIYPKKEEKPKILPREVAGKAVKQIATVPPRLMLYSILGAVSVILVVAVAIFFHVRSVDDGSTATPQLTQSSKSAAVAETHPAPALEKSTPSLGSGAEPQLGLTVRQVEKRAIKGNRRQPTLPAVVPSQALIDSTPQGALFQVDGKSDPSWVTPFTVAGLSPGKHIISASRTGYSSEIRSLDVAAGSNVSLVFHLSPMNAMIIVNSTPPGAIISLDGKPTGRVTPAQFAVEKGSHTLVLRKQGYLDETASADLAPAQNFQYAPILKALGNTEDMRTVGKFNKLFGHGGESTAGMGAISIHTQPKGAQVSINQRVLDKASPVDVMVGPGNYVVDITMTGFKPLHKVVAVDKGSKAAIDETLDRQ